MAAMLFYVFRSFNLPLALDRKVDRKSNFTYPFFFVPPSHSSWIGKSIQTLYRLAGAKMLFGVRFVAMLRLILRMVIQQGIQNLSKQCSTTFDCNVGDIIFE